MHTLFYSDSRQSNIIIGNIKRYTTAFKYQNIQISDILLLQFENSMLAGNGCDYAEKKIEKKTETKLKQNSAREELKQWHKKHV